MRPMSVSQHTTLTGPCTEQYRLQRIERVPQMEAAWFEHGKAVHSAIEAWENSRIYGKGLTDFIPLTEDEAVEVFELAYDQGIEAGRDRQPDYGMWLAGGRTKPETDIRNRRQRGAEQVRTYIAWALGDEGEIWATPDGKPAIELEFNIELGGIPVRGFIDQIVDDPYLGLVVRDVKTGTTKHLVQLVTYKFAIEKTYGVEVNWGDWWMGKTGSTTPPVDLSVFSEEWLAEQFKASTAIREMGLYAANPGDHCFPCTSKRSCFFYLQGCVT